MQVFTFGGENYAKSTGAHTALRDGTARLRCSHDLRRLLLINNKKKKTLTCTVYFTEGSNIDYLFRFNPSNEQS